MHPNSKPAHAKLIFKFFSPMTYLLAYTHRTVNTLRVLTINSRRALTQPQTILHYRTDLYEKKLEIIDLYEDDDKNKNPVKVMKNKNAHNRNLVQSFGNIINVLGDSNCGFMPLKLY